MATAAQLQRLDEQHRQKQAVNAGAMVLALAQVWKQVTPAELTRTGATWLAQAIALIASRRRLSTLYSLDYARRIRGLQVGLDDAPAVLQLDFDRLIREWEDTLGGARGRRWVDLADLPELPPGVPPLNLEQIRESLIHVGLRQTAWDLHRTPGRRTPADPGAAATPEDVEEFIRDGERIGRENQSIDEMERAIMAAAQKRAAQAAVRHVHNGGRDAADTVVRSDLKARGYIRITRPACCHFCAMLASRGPVYSEDSFDESDPRFTGPGNHKVHDECGCTLRPVYTRDGSEWTTIARESSDIWEEIRKAKGGRTPTIKEFRERWDARNESLRASMQ